MAFIQSVNKQKLPLGGKRALAEEKAEGKANKQLDFLDNTERNLLMMWQLVLDVKIDLLMMTMAAKGHEI